MVPEMTPVDPASNKGFVQRALDVLERWGNKLPDPALLLAPTSAGTLGLPQEQM